ncbi:hypothetical protein [Niabella aquatica]
MSKDRQGNILRYCSNNCVMVINRQGSIREVFTPFLVTAVNSLPGRKKTYIVEEVLSSQRGELVYVINGNRYHYAQFLITINF